MIFLCITTVALCILICLVYRYSFFKNQVLQWQLRRKGVEAEAILLHIEQTGVYINHQPQVKLQIKVQPRTGRNFVTEIRDVLPPASRLTLRVGSTLRVRYNPADVRELEVLHQ